jgi:hypothetical protein
VGSVNAETAVRALRLSSWRRSCQNQHVDQAINGVWIRVKLAFAAFFTILFKGRLPVLLQPLPQAPPTARSPAAPAAVEDSGDRAVQILALMQREGRLVDFLMEDLGAYSDAQIGASVREVHGGCRRVLDRYVTLEPVLDGREGESISVAQDLNPAAIRLVGNVTGRPPFTGRLLHPGWRISRVQLPPLGDAAARTIVAQAEVEVA